MATPPATNAREVFELLRDDLAAIEREFGRDTVSSVRVITEIGEYLRAGGGKRIRSARAADQPCVWRERPPDSFYRRA